MKQGILVALFLTVLLIAIAANASACGGGSDSDGDSQETSRSEVDALRALVSRDLGDVVVVGFERNEAWLAQARTALPRLERFRDDLEQLNLFGLYDEARENLVLSLDRYQSGVI